MNRKFEEYSDLEGKEDTVWVANYSDADFTTLLDIVEDVMHLGCNQWKEVEGKFKERAAGKKRS